MVSLPICASHSEEADPGAQASETIPRGNDAISLPVQSVLALRAAIPDTILFSLSTWILGEHAWANNLQYQLASLTGRCRRRDLLDHDTSLTSGPTIPQRIAWRAYGCRHMHLPTNRMLPKKAVAADWSHDAQNWRHLLILAESGELSAAWKCGMHELGNMLRKNGLR